MGAGADCQHEGLHRALRPRQRQAGQAGAGGAGAPPPQTAAAAYLLASLPVPCTAERSAPQHPPTSAACLLPQSKEKVLAKMVREGLTEKVETERAVKFSFTQVGKLPPPVLQFTNVTFGYSKDKVLYRNVDLGADLDSRVAIVSA